MMGMRLCLGVASLAAAGILTATAAARHLPQDRAPQAPSINVNRALKADRQLSSGGHTIMVRTLRISPAAREPREALRELPGCEAAVSALADRAAGRQMRRCDT
jgi:hypothetical protein